MGLRYRQFQPFYRSDQHSVVRDFLVPAMIESVRYNRAVGYFTSSSLAHAARGITSLVENGGSIRLIASPHLIDEDIGAIADGYHARDDVIRLAIARSFESGMSELTKNRLSALSWLVAESRLEIKLAYRSDKHGRPVRGIYHEKIGVFVDDEQDKIAFTGSANESEGGLISNFESIDVYLSWDDPQDRVAQKLNDFEKLWHNMTPGLTVIEFTEATHDILRPYKTESVPTRAREEELENEEQGVSVRSLKGPRLPLNIKLRDYQTLAINNWFKNQGRGIFKLATGTGKTITALAAATKLRKASKIEAVLVVAPYKHLIDQWAKECAAFGIHPLRCYESRSLWFDRLSSELTLPRDAESPLLAVITTNSTFGSDDFQRLLSHWPITSLIIVDEVHHYGSRSLYETLPWDGFKYRLGLSATPERFNDDVGSQLLLDYFGEVVPPEISVGDAIKMGALCPYQYFPIRITLNADEEEAYQRITNEVAQMLDRGSGYDDPALVIKMNQRARMVENASGKLVALAGLARQIKPFRNALVYCGSGSLDIGVPESKEIVRHVDVVCRLLGEEIGIRVAKYTAETSIGDREKIMHDLVAGNLQALVAINCLDEGVDIPCVETAIIMSSSTNPRQFIQRRGRILRLFPKKRSARIFDMVVVPSLDEAPTKGARTLMAREMARYLEFAKTAMNCGEAEANLMDLQQHFHLLDM